jgi:hypothetical protein
MPDVDQLGDPGAQELLSSPQPLRLAYAGSDGFPRVVPVGFLWKDERIYVCTAITAPKKVAALRERPHVAGVIDEGISSSDAKQLLVRGIAEVEIVDGVAPEYFEVAAKGERDRPRRVREKCSRGLRPTGANLDHPEWARFYDFGAGKPPPFLRKLAGAD